MNTLTKSLIALTLLTGTLLSAGHSSAQSPVTLPAPAPAQSALNALLVEPNSPLPADTRLLSLRVADGLATVNFSRELRDNFAGGDTAETRAVNSILQALGQFPTVARVQILVAGQPIDSLGGLLVLSNPLPVIRPAAGQPGQIRWLHRKSALSARHRGDAQKRAMPAPNAR